MTLPRARWLWRTRAGTASPHCTRRCASPVSLIFPPSSPITSAELTAAHIRGGRQAWVLRGLLDAVIAAPQINFPEALLALAKTLAGQA